ncbi:Octapeptide-repeat protein T2, partial [Ophiophagus hannah]
MSTFSQDLLCCVTMVGERVHSGGIQPVRTTSGEPVVNFLSSLVNRLLEEIIRAENRLLNYLNPTTGLEAKPHEEWLESSYSPKHLKAKQEIVDGNQRENQPKNKKKFPDRENHQPVEWFASSRNSATGKTQAEEITAQNNFSFDSEVQTSLQLQSSELNIEPHSGSFHCYAYSLADLVTMPLPVHEYSDMVVDEEEEEEERIGVSGKDEKEGRKACRKAGRKEGRQAGRKEGRQAGRKAGKLAGRQEGRKEGRKLRTSFNQNRAGWDLGGSQAIFQRTTRQDKKQRMETNQEEKQPRIKEKFPDS